MVVQINLEPATNEGHLWRSLQSWRAALSSAPLPTFLAMRGLKLWRPRLHCRRAQLSLPTFTKFGVVASSSTGAAFDMTQLFVCVQIFGRRRTFEWYAHQLEIRSSFKLVADVSVSEREQWSSTLTPTFVETIGWPLALLRR